MILRSLGAMSKRAWLTPDTIPASEVCWRVFIPDGEAWAAAFKGAMRLLELSWNWEKYGTLTPDQVSDHWVQISRPNYQQVSCQSGGAMQIGAIFWFPSTTIPIDTLECDGSQLNTTTYAALFAVVGYSFGGADEVFNLPDLREYFVRGASGTENPGDTAGANVHTLTEDEMPNHRHTIKSVSGFVASPPYTAQVGYSTGGGSYNSGQKGGNQSHNNIPSYVALVPVIQAL